MTTRFPHLPSTLVLLAIAAPAAAQTARALLVEGGPLPGAVGQTVSSLNNTAVNHVGGYAVSVNADNGVTSISHVWGNATGGAGVPLRTEGTIGSLQQTSFESFYGISDTGQVAYSPSTNDLMGGFTGLDGVWLDDTVIAIERDPVPSLGGQFWSFGSRPGVTGDGMPYWVGGFTSTAGGATQNRGLFLGAGATVLLMGNQNLPNLPLALGTSTTLSFDYRLSAYGAHSIAEVQLLGAASTADFAMALDQQGLLIDGSLVREGSPVPATAGGLVGENWSSFDYAGVTESGSWFFTGDTSAATTTDEIVVVDGTIVLREGDTVSGQTLAGDIEGGYRNEDGDLALVWDIATGQEVLILNGQIVLTEGDPVDFDGDGLAEPGSLLADFTGISTLTLGDRAPNGRVDVYFTADIDFNGTTTTTDDLEGFFRLRVRVAPPGGLFKDRDDQVSVSSQKKVVPLNVASDLADTWITLSPADANGEAGGYGGFERAFEPGTSVTLEAPLWAQGRLHTGWLVDGVEIAAAAPLTLPVTGATRVEPVYLRLEDAGR